MDGNLVWWTRARRIATLSVTLSATLAAGAGLVVPCAQAQRVAVVAPVQRTVTLKLEHASLAEALRAIAGQVGLRSMFSETILPAHSSITLSLHEVPVMEAFQEALRGTGLVASIRPTGYVLIEREQSERDDAGVIRGTVVDANGEKPLQALVIVDGKKPGVATSSDGSFQVSGIAPGTHRISARSIGYATQTKTVAVTNDTAITIRFVLDRSVGQLDQVVVTGTVIPTELKAVPNAITVITAKELEQRGITHIDQLFRGDVPGLFATTQGSGSLKESVLMFSRGATSLGQSNGTSFGTNPIKTYVDGVEMADPQYLSQIDPRSIERIEILTGPQASTIYGSNALNGVMQIFTKRGTTTRPQLTLNVQSGFVQNNFSSALTPQHDDNVQVSGVEGRISYSADESWNYVGAWTPAKQTTRTNTSGGAHLELPTSVGVVNADVTLRLSNTRTRELGDPNQSTTAYSESGFYYTGRPVGVFYPITWSLNGQTLGFTLGYAPTSWWSHEFNVGQDAETSTTPQRAGYISVSDTTVGLGTDSDVRRSLRYSTTARVPLSSLAQATVTAGADNWQELSTSVSVSNTTLIGNLSNGGFTSVYRLPGHNAGAFIQSQLALFDQLFFTYGLRAEWNPDFGAKAQPNYAPRYAVVYTTDAGPITAKVRASYGKSTRPPSHYQEIGLRNTNSFLTPIYGVFNSQVANPALSPEYQQGGEGGIELYLGTRASLIVTRYNQTVNGIIGSIPGADSVRSLTPNPIFFGFAPCSLMIQFHIPTYCSSQDAQGYGYAQLTQNINIAGLRNQGWELQGSVNTGPLTTKGTYSWTKSRSLGVTPQFQSAFSSQLSSYPQYARGATFQYVPEHTWALGFTYTQARTTVALNFTGNGSRGIQGDKFFDQNLSGNIRLQQDRASFNSNGYIAFTNGYTMADLNATQRFTQRVEGVLQVANLGNTYPSDINSIYAQLGRQFKTGLRVRW